MGMMLRIIRVLGISGDDEDSFFDSFSPLPFQPKSSLETCISTRLFRLK
jgi:hypothetical protein